VLKHHLDEATRAPGRRKYQHFEEYEEAPFEEDADLEGLYDFPGPGFPTQYAPVQTDIGTEEETKELARAGTFLEQIRGVIDDKMQMTAYAIYDHAVDFTSRSKQQREVEAGSSEKEVIKKARQEDVTVTAEVRGSHETSVSEPTPIIQSTLEMAPSTIPTTSAHTPMETALSAAVIMTEIALLTSEVKALTLAVAQQVLIKYVTQIKSATQAVQPIVSERTMEAAITIFSAEGEEEEELVDYFDDSNAAVDTLFEDYANSLVDSKMPSLKVP
ncbi:uncharacterized protein A4U43_C07F9830, partial [Asparagus officinalis]